MRDNALQQSTAGEKWNNAEGMLREDSHGSPITWKRKEGAMLSIPSLPPGREAKRIGREHTFQGRQKPPDLHGDHNIRKERPKDDGEASRLSCFHGDSPPPAVYYGVPAGKSAGAGLQSERFQESCIRIVPEAAPGFANLARVPAVAAAAAARTSEGEKEGGRRSPNGFSPAKAAAHAGVSIPALWARQERAESPSRRKLARWNLGITMVVAARLLEIVTANKPRT